MPYWRLFYHVVWSTHQRQALIQDAWEDKLFAYLLYQAPKWQGRIFAVNGMSDHIHLAVAVAPSIALADFIGRLKGGSAHYVNNTIQPIDKLIWQAEYGIHSMSAVGLPKVIKYIENQKKHHAERSLINGLEKW